MDMNLIAGWARALLKDKSIATQAVVVGACGSMEEKSPQEKPM